MQLRNTRQINAETIAKNHYREMLEAFLKNNDILSLGSNQTAFAELKKDTFELFSEASVAIDGSEFKAVNTRDRNFTQAKMQRRLAQIQAGKNATSKGRDEKRGLLLPAGVVSNDRQSQTI